MTKESWFNYKNLKEKDEFLLLLTFFIYQLNVDSDSYISLYRWRFRSIQDQFNEIVKWQN